MPRSANEVATEQITLSTTPQVKTYLSQLAQSGLWGKNAAEAAERLVADQIRRLIQDGTLPKAKR